MTAIARRNGVKSGFWSKKTRSRTCPPPHFPAVSFCSAASVFFPRDCVSGTKCFSTRRYAPRAREENGGSRAEGNGAPHSKRRRRSRRKTAENEARYKLSPERSRLDLSSQILLILLAKCFCIFFSDSLVSIKLKESLYKSIHRCKHASNARTCIG